MTISNEELNKYKAYFVMDSNSKNHTYVNNEELQNNVS